ncbi:S-layer homology domain-containing protein [Tumebacillus permanentifrigoris]|nr:S-layer homology domain-containing protein [Tumebacillus permanentifrigoris]
MKTKWLAILSAIALLAPAGGVYAATNGTHVTLHDVLVKHPGENITITGTSSYSVLLMKVVKPDGTLLYFDQTKPTGGNYSLTFALPVDAATGVYHIVTGQNNDVAVDDFEVTPDPTQGGGGGGGGGIPGGGGGNKPPSDILDIPTDMMQVKTTTNSDKQKVLDITLVDSKLSDLIDADGSGKKVINIKVAEAGDVVHMNLTVDAVHKLDNKAPESTFQVTTSLGTISLPTNALRKALDGLQLPVENKVQVTLTKVLPSEEDLVKQTIHNHGGEQASTPVDFLVQAVLADGQTVDVQDLAAYVSHTLNLSAAVGQVDNNNLAGLYVDASRNFVYPMPTLFTVAGGQKQGSILRKGNSVYALATNHKSFADVTSDHYAKTSIERLANKLVINGYEDSSFRPAGHVTRAEFVTLLVRSLGILPASELTGNAQFRDVSADEWYAGSIQAAVQAGLVKGFEDKTFRPNLEISRQEMVQMMVNGLRSVDPKQKLSAAEVDTTLRLFPDASSIEGWAAEAVAIAVRAGIVHGMEDQTFAPQGTADRAQSAVVLDKMMQSLHFINE